MKMVCGVAAIALLALAISGPALAGSSKVQVCHIPPGNPENFHTITVGEKALQVDLTVQQCIASLSPRLNRGAPSFTGGISGTITLEGVGTPLPAIAVLVFDDGNSYITEGMTDGSGVYEVSDLADGSYFLKTYNYSGHIDELYDDIECAGGGGWGLCDHLSGTPVVVTGGLVTSGINFQLVVGGTISGNVTEDAGGADIDFLRVDIYSSTGDWMSFGLTESDGDYLGQQGLPSGTYYAMTDSGNTGLHYQDEIYDDITCGFDCDPTTGDAIAVTVGVATPGIDFALVDGGWISGTITDHSTGLPIEEAGISFYTASGDWFADGYADSNGDYTSRGGLPTGDYYAHSFNWAGYADELYDDFDCSFGCDVTTGTPVGVTLGIETPGIDFALVPIEIFFDGFESGDTSAWFNTVP